MRVAAVLRVPVDELHEAAGYTKSGEVVASFDRPLPLHALTPDAFERFCADLLQSRLGPGTKVERAGKEGHKQHGIDISFIDGDGFLQVFQCKRREEFGPSRVKAAMAAASAVQARQKTLLLSCVASPAARSSLAGTDWQLWDQDDISRMFRALPMQDQVDIVDRYFRGQRFALLGQEEAGPWQTPEKFFAPFLTGKAFGHDWLVVGRDAELRQLSDALHDPKRPYIFLVGSGGSGKSRILLELIQAYLRTTSPSRVRMLAPQVPLTPASLEAQGNLDTLFVVDDAHDRDDLGLLLRHVETSSGRSRLLLSLRPYGLDSVRRQAAHLSVESDSVTQVTLGPLSKEAATELARQVLVKGDGPSNFAPTIAEHTHESPLLTVLSAHVAARDKLHPHFIADTDEFRHRIQLEFERVVTQEIATGADGARMTELLSLIALVQPVAKDDKALLDLITAVTDIALPQAVRLLNLLVGAGVLFQRGRNYRLAPDLLSDSIIERCCFSPSGASLNYAERVFDIAPASYLKNLMLNLGRLDWRRNRGDTSSSDLLSGIWSKLKWSSSYINPHVQAAVGVAYYQPQQTIAFATRLIREGHGQERDVAQMLKYAAYNQAHAPDAMLLLWKIGRSGPAADGRTANHAMRILSELAAPEPSKPAEYVRTVVDFFIGILKRPNEPAHARTPFDVLESALALESRVHTARRAEILITRYHVDLDLMSDVRIRIRDAVIDCLTSSNLQLAYRAATMLSQCIRGSMNGFINEEQRERHEAYALKAIAAATDVAQHRQLPATVLVRMAQSITAQARSRSEDAKAMVQAVCAQLDRDLPTKVIRALMDAWGKLHDSIHDDYRAVAEQNDKWLNELVQQVHAAYPDSVDLARFLDDRVNEMNSAKPARDSGHRFLRMLVATSPSLSEHVLAMHRSSQPHPLAEHASQALATMLASSSDPDAWIGAYVNSGSSTDLGVLAEALTLAGEPAWRLPHARRAMRSIVESKDASVLWHGAYLMLRVAQFDAAFALDLICRVDFAAAKDATKEYFMLLSPTGQIPAASLGKANRDRLLANLAAAAELDDYWILEFLKESVKQEPRSVVALVQARLLRTTQERDWIAEALCNNSSDQTLGLLDTHHGVAALIELLNWSLEHIETAGFADRLGTAAETLCGQTGVALLEVVLGWLHFGTEAHAKVAAALIAHCPFSMLVEHSSDVIRILEEVEPISEAAVQELHDAFWRASVSGVRTSTPGQPTSEDIQMVRVAAEVLSQLTPLDPAYSLYSSLKRDAENSIGSVRRQREAMEEEL
ncbi:restriction endonuclease [Pseudorhodoferax soli]|uniref:Restriction endonuclease n=2 Tax=Pseudorhodoferax soli TaxID=545864 RepID=A0A368XKZ1_9BURK|nr:restriction endonuclease [Pseudorhodoferax soli]